MQQISWKSFVTLCVSVSVAEQMQVGKPTVPMEGAMTMSMSQPAQPVIKKKVESSLSPFTSDAEDAKARK